MSFIIVKIDLFCKTSITHFEIIIDLVDSTFLWFLFDPTRKLGGHFGLPCPVNGSLKDLFVTDLHYARNPQTFTSYFLVFNQRFFLIND